MDSEGTDAGTEFVSDDIMGDTIVAIAGAGRTSKGVTVWPESGLNGGGSGAKLCSVCGIDTDTLESDSAMLHYGQMACKL